MKRGPYKQGRYHQLMREASARIITAALAATDGNQSAAARDLGLSRVHLIHLIRSTGVAATVCSNCGHPEYVHKGCPGYRSAVIP